MDVFSEQKLFNAALLEFLNFMQTLFPEVERFKTDVEDVNKAMMFDIPAPSKEFLEKFFPYEKALIEKNAHAFDFSDINHEKIKRIKDPAILDRLWEELQYLYDTAKTAQPTMYTLLKLRNS